MPEELLVVEDLVKRYPVRGAWGRRTHEEVRAVDGISFTVARGETLGLIGESGSGKSTTGYCVLRLIEPDGGSIRLGGVDVTHADDKALRTLRREMQIIFQNPYASLDPRRRIGASIAEPLVAHRIGTRESRRDRVAELLEQVGLSPAVAARYPQEFSGGQRQRIGIARALALEPKLIVCDEAVSSLDVSVQAQILNLLQDLQDQLGLAYLFISHDIAVVDAVSDRIAVMRAGRIEELGTSDQVCRRPSNTYTRALLDAVNVPDPAPRPAPVH